MTGKIILLNGASSAGKSTIAAALQARLDEPFWHFSIDHLIAANMLPSERIRSGEFDWPRLREAFFKGFHQCLPALASAGNHLVVEHIVESREWMERLLELLGAVDVFFVGVHCPLDELERRERQRGDRRIGEARVDHERTHALCIYDFEVSSDRDPADSATDVIAAWRSRERPSAFDRMRALAN